jgi:2-phosphosulfolactate phosphatase
MPTSLEVLFAPAEFAALTERHLPRTTCVVFDVFRATSTIVTALAHGAESVIPVAEILEALAWRKKRPDVLLAGEREGLRIRADLTGGIDFDLGNSPSEFTGAHVKDRTIVLSTTNGSRALRACANAKAVLASSFLNLQATADYLNANFCDEVLLVCSGTHDEAAYEDALGAGALVELLWNRFSGGTVTDSARIALQIYQQNSRDLLRAAEHCRNGRRLLSMPELRDDVAWCLKRDEFPLVAKMEGEVIKAHRDSRAQLFKGFDK